MINTFKLCPLNRHFLFGLKLNLFDLKIIQKLVAWFSEKLFLFVELGYLMILHHDVQFYKNLIIIDIFLTLSWNISRSSPLKRSFSLAHSVYACVYLLLKNLQRILIPIGIFLFDCIAVYTATS